MKSVQKKSENHFAIRDFEMLGKERQHNIDATEEHTLQNESTVGYTVETN